MIKNFLTVDEAVALNNIGVAEQNIRLGDAVKSALQGNVGYLDYERYYVKADSGNDNNSGESWDDAFATIQAALNAARYIRGTTTVDYSKDRRKFVFVYPGVYNEQILFSGYNISLIGCLGRLGNVDYGVVINKDEAVTTTCVLGFTGAGIEIAGLQIHNAAAIPTVSIPTPGDGCSIHDCYIDGDDTNATIGIHWPDMRNSEIYNNRIFNHVTAGIQIGSNGAWFRNSSIENNHIAGSQGKGIYVPTGTICGAGFGSKIKSNCVMGTCATGIHQEAAGAYVLVADNWVQATTPVTDAGTGAADNHNAS